MKTRNWCYTFFMTDIDWEAFDKSERERFEHESYEKSESEDDFITWKLKKYVDERIMGFVFTIIGVIIGIALVQYFLK